MATTVTLANSSQAQLSSEEVYLRSIPASIKLEEMTIDALRLLIYYVSKQGPFELAVESGYFEGTLSQWLESLKANISLKASVTYYHELTQLTTLNVGDLVYVAETELVYIYNGTSFPPKENGIRLTGASVYQTALQQGFKGTVDEWLLTLKGDALTFNDLTADQIKLLMGPQGKSAYEVAVKNGFVGSELSWLQTLKGAKGDIGPEGKSSYKVAVDMGFDGSATEWLQSLKGLEGSPGKSPYQIAIENGYVGTEKLWLDTLRGSSAFQLAVQNGFSGSVQQWLETLQGQSAYELALEKGFVGSEVVWLKSLEGLTAYQLAVKNGAEENEQTWLKNLQGKSAYAVAVDSGYSGTQEEWLASLNGASSYRIAKQLGFEGSEIEWLDSLVGPQGPTGKSTFELVKETGLYKGTQAQWLAENNDLKTYVEQAKVASNTAVSSNKATVEQLQSISQSVISATNGTGFYEKEEDLLKAVPTQNTLSQALDTKKVYFWDGSKWLDSGLGVLDLIDQSFNSNPTTKPKRLDATSDLDLLIDAGFYMVPTNAIASTLAIPSDYLGVLYVSGLTQDKGYVLQIYYDREGSVLFRYRGAGFTWNPWRGYRYDSFTDGVDLNTITKQGSYAIIDSSHADLELNYPVVGTGTSGLLTVSTNRNNGLITQIYTCRKGVFTRYYTTKNDWGVWTGIINDLSGISNFKDFLKIGENNQQIVEDLLTITSTGHIDNCFTEGTFHLNTSKVASAEAGFPITGSGGFFTVKKNTAGATIQTWQTYTGYAYRWGSGSAAKPKWQPWKGYTATSNSIIDLTNLNKEEDTLIVYGSSTMWYLSNEFTDLAAKYKLNFLNHGISGDGLQGAGMGLGVNKVYIQFPNGVITTEAKQAVTVTSTFNLKQLQNKTVELPNGVKGTLYNNNTFTPTNLTQDLEVLNEPLLVKEPKWTDRDYKGTYVINIGKNNVSSSTDNSQDILDKTNAIIDYLPKGSNFVVGGHFSNFASTDMHRTVVEKVNASLKLKYGLKYFDINSLLFDDQTWVDLDLTKTEDDLVAIEDRRLPPSLSRNASHLSEAMDIVLANKIEETLLSLSYLKK